MDSQSLPSVDDLPLVPPPLPPKTLATEHVSNISDYMFKLDSKTLLFHCMLVWTRHIKNMRGQIIIQILPKSHFFLIIMFHNFRRLPISTSRNLKKKYKTFIVMRRPHPLWCDNEHPQFKPLGFLHVIFHPINHTTSTLTLSLNIEKRFRLSFFEFLQNYILPCIELVNKNHSLFETEIISFLL